MMTKMVFKVLSKEWSQRHQVDQDLRQRVNQDDQHTKRTRCTERDQVIPWYGKHCPLRVCVLTHGLRESSMWGLGVFTWACVKRKISYNPWSMTSSCDRHQDCDVQVQVDQHEDSMLEACRPLWWQWTCEDMLKSGSPIVEYAASNLLVFIKPTLSRNVVHLEEAKIIVIQLKRTRCKVQVCP